MENLSLVALTLLTASFSGAITPEEPPLRHALPLTLHQISSVDSTPIILKDTPEQYSLPESNFVSQSFNNCGPAALSMVFSTYGKFVSQEELASKMRPYNNPFGDNDDKSTFPEEFVSQAKSYGFEALTRPNGNNELLKKLIAHDIPVVVRTWLNPQDDTGHFRIIRGYDDTQQVFIQDDSYQGKNISFTYSEVEDMWKPFNYGYILVYPKEKQSIVEAILGEDMDEKVAYQKTAQRAEKALDIDPDDALATMNYSTALYHLGDYEKSVAEYEKVKDKLPALTLWYQLEPLYAYQKVKQYDRIFEIADKLLSSGNLAYSEIYFMRGEIYRERGEIDAARQEFEKAVYFNTTFTPAQKALESL